MKIINKLFIVLIVLSSAGCQNPSYMENKQHNINPTETYHVYVDSINDGNDHKNKTYVISPGVKGVSENDLQYKEYAQYLHRALQKAGYKKASSKDKANINILFVYGIGEPEKETSYQTTSLGALMPLEYSFLALATSKTTAHTEKTYTRTLLLDAYDYSYFKSTGKEKQLWLTKATSSGTRDDLRVVLPVVITAVVPYIGTNTREKTKLVVGAPSRQLYEIMGKKIQ
jgi:hypothetical protein